VDFDVTINYWLDVLHLPDTGKNVSKIGKYKSYSRRSMVQ
jgi:hypothetical protein